MASVKIVLRTNYQKTDGSCPLALRITKDRKTRYVFTGKYVLEKHWDKEFSKVKKSHPNSARLNNFLLKKLSNANDSVLELTTANDNVTSKQIKNKIKPVIKSVSFFDLAAKRIKDYQLKGTFSVANAEQSMVNNLKKFLKDRNLFFQDITVPFIEKFKVYAAATLGQKPRTITNHLIFMRTMYNIAIKKGVVDSKYYPFSGDNIKIKIGTSMKVGLSKEDVVKIENLELEPGSPIWHTRNVWLFAFYFAGIRITDVLKMRWSDFKDGRLLYVMHKNNKPVSLKTPEKAKVILKHYQKDRRGSYDFIFPDLKKANQNHKKDIFVKTHTATKRFNRYLKQIAVMAEIDKNLSNHIARHSFGNIAGDTIHPLILQKLYRHSDLKTTINYQANFIHKEADEALDSVVDF